MLFDLGMRCYGQKLIDQEWSSSEIKCWRKAPPPKRKAPPQQPPDSCVPGQAKGPTPRPKIAAPPPKARTKAKKKARRVFMITRNGSHDAEDATPEIPPEEAEVVDDYTEHLRQRCLDVLRSRLGAQPPPPAGHPPPTP